MAVKTRTRSARLLVVILVSISLVTITLDYKQGDSGPLAGLGRSTTALMAPLQKGVTAVTRPVGRFLSALVHLPSQQTEIDRLKRELDSARAQVIGEASVQRELQQLKDLLVVRDQLRGAPTATASVISSGVSNFEWTVTIDAGAGDGIAVDDPVVAGGGLVGHVVRVAPNASVVQLIIDPQSSVAVRLVSSGKTGLLDGAGEGDMHLQFFDPATVVDNQESVETAGYRLAGGQGGLYPRGILVGTVSHVVPQPGALQQFVTVQPAVDFSSLDFVLVVKTSDASG